MSMIKNRKKQALNQTARINVNFEKSIYKQVKRLARIQEKSISKFIADSVIILHELDDQKGDEKR